LEKLLILGIFLTYRIRLARLLFYHTIRYDRGV